MSIPNGPANSPPNWPTTWQQLRDRPLAQGLARAIERALPAGHTVRLMEFCGGHTHALSRHGLQDLLPPGLRLIHGPGCPVCVLPVGRIDQAIALAQRPGVTVCTYGDVLRVPASDRLTLRKAQALGAQVRMVTSPLQALQWAREHPEREVVFLAIGFETTAPATAVVLQQARAEGLRRFSVLCHHVLTPAAMHALLSGPHPPTLDGFIGPGHVSTVIGAAAYEGVARQHRKPVVIAGFEPLDMLQAIWLLVRQLAEGRHEVENAFTRAVTPTGNAKAQALMQEVFALREAFEWRGLGTLPHSALRLHPAYAAFDAEQRFDLAYRPVPDHKACECAAVVRGDKRPQECRIFGTGCTPDQPVGACMVSPEGACAAHYQYGRWRDAPLP
jgi:hydrogenase expression/formation protein HypD